MGTTNRVVEQAYQTTYTNGIDSLESISRFLKVYKLVLCADILEQSIGGSEPNRNRVVVPARQATLAGGLVRQFVFYSIPTVYSLHC
jgi:hypothetical protein